MNNTIDNIFLQIRATSGDKIAENQIIIDRKHSFITQIECFSMALQTEFAKYTSIPLTNLNRSQKSQIDKDLKDSYRKNLIQLLIGIEVIAKGVTLSFILAGFFQGNEQIAQAIVITVIVIEAVTAAIVMALIVRAYRHTGSLDVKDFKKLRG